ncbi:MAG: DMT family transporter [Desulfobacterales bacterium]|nr:DMT family transporter [Desulfobacterales bacterium]
MNTVKNILARFKHFPAGLQLAFGAALISFSGVYVKLARVTPAAAGFYRMAFGGLVLLAVIALRREIRWPGSKFFFLGLICSLWFTVDLFCWHVSIHHVGPGLATLLANFQVFFLALAGVIFLGEKIRLKLVLAVPLALVGLFMLVGVRWGQFGPDYRIGVYLGLGAAVCYAGFLLTLRKLQAAENGVSAMATLTLVSFFTVCFLALEIWRTGDTFRIPDVQSGVLLVAYGVSSQALGWVMITRALPHVRASFAGLVLLLQPSLSYVWDILFFNKIVTTVGMAGLVLTLLAIYLGSTRTAD